MCGLAVLRSKYADQERPAPADIEGEAVFIHAIDIVQPPGIGISPIAGMDAHQTIVTAALAAKSSAETPKKARWEVRSETMRREISLK